MNIITQRLMLLIGLLLFGIHQASIAAEPDHGGAAGVTESSILLGDGELERLEIKAVSNSSWIVGWVEDGVRGAYSPAISQQIRISGHDGNITYADFESEELARAAALLSMEQSALFYKEGIWEDASNESVGDQAWHAMVGYSASLVVRSGSTLFMIQLHPNQELLSDEEIEQLAKLHRLDEQKAFQFEKGAPVRHLMEQVARHLADKAKAGARVPVLEE